MPTINEIAKAAGCSVSTVSKALNGYPYVNEKTRSRILGIAKELDFTPNYFARSLMTKRSFLVGVLISDENNYGLLHPLFGGVIEGFKREIERRNYEILLIKQEYLNSEINFVEHCVQRGIEGVFIVVANMKEQSLFDLCSSDIPCVSVDLYHDNISTVLPDNFMGGYNATIHLLELGHRRIAHIAGNQNKPAGTDRLLGYKKALEEYGIEYDEELVVFSEDYTTFYGKNAMNRLLDRHGRSFTALFAASDTLAIGAYTVCRENSISIPDEISVVGFDNIDTSEFLLPPLTTVRQMRLETGEAAGGILADMIETGEKPIQHIKLAAELIIRESTCRFSAKT